MRRYVADWRRERHGPGPRLTVGIPLHRAAAWVDNVSQNLSALPPGTTVLLSDLTAEDDALAKLRRRHRYDRFVRVAAAAPAAGWREHYNHLLAAATTELFAWLPQDDRITAGYYEGLVGALDACSTASLAFGPMVSVGADFREPAVFTMPPMELGVHLPEYEAVTLMRHWNLGVAFRGVFRRPWSRPLPSMPGGHHADVFWVFGLALSGHLVPVRDSVYVKRFHAENTHEGWPELTPRDCVEACEREIRVGSPVRSLSPDASAWLRAAFADQQ
jgi:hypothetical protein